MNNEETNTPTNGEGSTTTYHTDGTITITGSMVPGIVGDSTPFAFSPGLQLLEEETETAAEHK
jgi:hypothetical protein